MSHNAELRKARVGSDQNEAFGPCTAGQSALRNISRGSYTVGSFVFEADDGGTVAAGRGCAGVRRAVLLTNYDWANTQTPTVDFGQDCRVMEVPCFRRACWTVGAL